MAAADRRLTAHYLDNLKASGQSQFAARVSHISSSGFTVKLDENGLEGFVDLRPEEEKFSFDKWTMSLTSTTRRFQLMQSVDVAYIGAPEDDDFLSLFSLVEGCGLKPPKEPSAAATDAQTEEPPVAEITAPPNVATGETPADDVSPTT